MKKDNKGLSLIELLVAFALLSVISLIILGIMTSASRMYQKVSTDVSLQMQSQITMAQIKEYVVDANQSIRFEPNGLIIQNTDENHAFYQVDDKITYNGDLLASQIQSFAAFPDWADNGTIKSVTVSITFERNGEIYSATQVIALRNISVT
jgi:prepilin-type N-terminal cleavage/methylation domain-containing protein